MIAPPILATRPITQNKISKPTKAHSIFPIITSPSHNSFSMYITFTYKNQTLIKKRLFINKGRWEYLMIQRRMLYGF